jgi:hypothetical protein
MRLTQLCQLLLRVFIQEHDGADIGPAGGQELQALLFGLLVGVLMGPDDSLLPRLQAYHRKEDPTRVPSSLVQKAVAR